MILGQLSNLGRIWGANAVTQILKYDGVFKIYCSFYLEKSYIKQIKMGKRMFYFFLWRDNHIGIIVLTLKVQREVVIGLTIYIFYLPTLIINIEHTFLFRTIKAWCFMRSHFDCIVENPLALGGFGPYWSLKMIFWYPYFVLHIFARLFKPPCARSMKFRRC